MTRINYKRPKNIIQHKCSPLTSFCAKRRLKLFTLSAAFKSLDIQFQSLHPRYVNERCPYDRRQRGMCKRLYDRVVLVWIWERGTNILARYFGTKSLGHLNKIRASLRRSLSLTVSQLRDLMPSEMWSSFLRPNTIRTAKICTKWSLHCLEKCSPIQLSNRTVY